MQATAAKPDLGAFSRQLGASSYRGGGKEHGVTPRDVVEALPAAMRRFASASAFVEVMGPRRWGEVTLIVHSDDAIMEFTGPISAGGSGRGYST